MEQYQNKIDQEQDRRITELEKATQTNRVVINALQVDTLWIKKEITKISDKVEVIEATLLGRPSWFIVSVISFMAGIIGVLSTIVINYIIFR